MANLEHEFVGSPSSLWRGSKAVRLGPSRLPGVSLQTALELARGSRNVRGHLPTASRPGPSLRASPAKVFFESSATRARAMARATRSARPERGVAPPRGWRGGRARRLEARPSRAAVSATCSISWSVASRRAGAEDRVSCCSTDGARRGTLVRLDGEQSVAGTGRHAAHGAPPPSRSARGPLPSATGYAGPRCTNR